MDPFKITVVQSNGTPLPLSDAFRPRFDDTIDDIKNKIFAGTSGEDAEDIVFWPKFQYLTVIDLNGKKVMLDPSRKLQDTFFPSNKGESLLSEATQSGLFKNNQITIEDLIETISEEPLLSVNSNKFNNLLAVLKEKYPYIAQSDLSTAQQFIEGDDSSSVRRFISDAQKSQGLLIERFEKENKHFANIPQNELGNVVVNRIVNRNKDGMYNFALLQALIEFQSPSIDTMIETGKTPKVRNFLDLRRVFNQLPLSEKVPFISVGSGVPKEPPFIKVLDKLKDDPVTKDLVEKWIIVERSIKKEGKQKLKQPKGLTFRVLSNKGIHNYIFVNLFDDGRITIRCSWPESDSAHLQEINDCVSTVVPVIKQINKIRVAFIGNHKIPELQMKKAIIRNLEAQLQVRSSLDKPKLKALIQQRGFLQFFVQIPRENKLKEQMCKELGISKDKCKKLKLGQVKSKMREKRLPISTEISQKDQVLVHYKRVSKREKRAFIRQGALVEEDLGAVKVQLIFRNSPKFDNTTVISVRNARSIQQLNLLFDFGVSMIRLNEKSKLEQLQKTVPVVEKTKKLDKKAALRAIGIEVNARDCQKPRQLVVDNAGIFQPKPGSYPLIINGNRLICTDDKNEGQIYPGYTKKGVPCCFKVDQRKTANFKRFHNPEEFKKEITSLDLEIRRENIITTDKLLLPGRIGVLPGEIGKYFGRFGNDFFRVGVFQDTDSFLNAVFEATKDSTKLNRLPELKRLLKNWLNSNSHFQSLQNGEIGRKFKRSEYISQVIESGVGDHTLLIGLVSRALKKTFFVFSEAKQNIVCYTDYRELRDFDQKKEVIFLIQKGVNYEPIMEVKGSKQVKREFAPNTPIAGTTKNMYTFSCKKTPEFKGDFKEAETAKFSFKALDSKGIKIIKQVVTAFNKAIYLVTEYKLLVPVRPSGPLGKMQIVGSYRDFIKHADDTKSELEKLVKKTKLHLTPKAKILKKGNVVALVLENGRIVPTKPTETTKVPGLSISKLNFSVNIDEFIRTGLTLDDPRVKLVGQIKANSGIIQQVRFELSNQLSKSIREKLKNLVLDATTTQAQKSKAVTKIMEKEIKEISIESVVEGSLTLRSTGLCSTNKTEAGCSNNPFCKYSIAKKECKVKIPKDKMKGIVRRIVHELITDTVEMKILNNRVTLLTSKVDEFIKRPGEIVLVNIDAARKWLQ